jgi:hypothetical protein
MPIKYSTTVSARTARLPRRSRDKPAVTTVGASPATGDDQGPTLQGRPEVGALFAEPDPQKLLAGLAGISVAINTRSTEVYRILVSASGSDPEAAALLTSYTRMRDQGQKLIAAALARAHALQPGMRERDAADIIHALMSPELYRLLVIDRDWPPERYGKWLTSTLIDRLLAPR